MTNQPESTPPQDNITSILSVINNLPVSEFLEDKDVEIDIPTEDCHLLPPQFKEIADKLHKQYLFWQILRNRQETSKPTFFGYIHQAINDSAKSVSESDDKNVDSQTVQLIETAITLATINALLIGAEEYITEGNHQQDVKESIDTALSTLYEFIKVREMMSSSLNDALEEIRQEIEGMSEAQQLASYVVTQIQRLRENPQIKNEAKFYVVKNQLEKLGKTLELLIPAEIKPQEEKTIIADESQTEVIIAKLLLKIVNENLYITTIHHQNWVESATFSPDSQYLATASEDKTAKVIEVATGKIITTIYHQGNVKSATFSSNGNYLVTASHEEVKITKLFTGKEINTIHHQGNVKSATFSSNGNYLVTASHEEVKITKLFTGKEINTIHHQGNVKSATFSSDGKYLATASEDKTAKVIEVATGKEITTIHHQDWVKSAIFSPDDKYLATASGYKTSKVIEVATGKIIITIHHQDLVKSVTFSPDAKYLAIASYETTKVIEVATGSEITTIRHQDWVKSATFSPDSQYLATASEDNTLKVIEVATGKIISTIHHQGSVKSATFSSDGKYLATASEDNTSKVIEVATGKIISTIHHKHWVNSATFSPDGNCLATASEDNTAKLVNLAKLRELLENNQNNIPPSNPPQVNALTYVDKPQAFFLRWLQNQANDYSFYEYLLKQAQLEKQGFSVHNQTPLLDTDLCLQSLNFLLLNAEKHYQSVFHTLKGIEDKSIQVIALYDMKQSIMAGLSTVHEFINNLMKFEGKDYQKAMEIFTEEIEKDVKTTEIATDIYRRSQSLSQLEGIENFGELATIKDMLGEMQEIFKQVLPLSITSPPPETPQIPLKVNQEELRRELIKAIKQAQPTDVKKLITHFISLGFKIDRQTAMSAINKYNRFIFVSPWDDVTDYQVLLRLLGD